MLDIQYLRERATVSCGYYYERFLRRFVDDNGNERRGDLSRKFAAEDIKEAEFNVTLLAAAEVESRDATRYLLGIAGKLPHPNPTILGRDLDVVQDLNATLDWLRCGLSDYGANNCERTLRDGHWLAIEVATGFPLAASKLGQWAKEACQREMWARSARPR